jgi:hypothetical protein
VPRRRRLSLTLAVPLVLACLSVPPPAAAGSYTVRQCDYAAGNGHHDFVWQSAGAPTVDVYAGSGCGEFGLAVRNSGGGTHRTYPSGAYGGWFAYAPNGTVITGFSGMFGVLSGCCVSGMASYAEATQHHDGRGARSYLFQGDLGNQTWGAPSGVGGPVGRAWSAATAGFDAKRVGFHLQCGPGFSCSQGIYGDLRLRGRSFDLTLRDDAPPMVGDPAGTLLTGGWVRGVRTLSFLAHDTGGGLTLVEAAFDSGLSSRWPSTCTTAGGRYARLQPCPAGRAAEWAVDTARLPDGGRHLHLVATDVGGAQTSRTVAVYVDNGAPRSPIGLALAGNGGWRAASDFELRWANPGEQHSPIAAAHWRACRVGAVADCAGGTRAAHGVAASGPIELPRAGEWDVALWLEDSVGNADPATAPQALRLRYDPDPPLLELHAQPARVTVGTSDLSGVASATVELRRHGSGGWAQLPATLEGDRIVADVDEARRAAGGRYDVRVRAVDAAGNAAVAHGVLELGAGAAPPPAWIGPPAAPAGPLLGARDGATPPRAKRPRALRAARVTMTARVRTGGRRAARRRGEGGRRGDGRGRSRKRGSRRPAVREVRRLTTVGGRPVLFGGRVSTPVPRGGKLVEVQAHFRGRWRTISVVRARRGGRWRFRYTFQTSPWPAHHRMRARVPAEAGYRFAAGSSRPVRVTVLASRS